MSPTDLIGDLKPFLMKKEVIFSFLYRTILLKTILYNVYFITIKNTHGKLEQGRRHEMASFGITKVTD